LDTEIFENRAEIKYASESAYIVLHAHVGEKAATNDLAFGGLALIFHQNYVWNLYLLAFILLNHGIALTSRLQYNKDDIRPMNGVSSPRFCLAVIGFIANIGYVETRVCVTGGEVACHAEAWYSEAPI